MPGDLDGIALAWHVAEYWPHIKVIVASGAIEPKRGVLPQTTTFFKKPISTELVNKALTEIFQA